MTKKFSALLLAFFFISLFAVDRASQAFQVGQIEARPYFTDPALSPDRYASKYWAAPSPDGQSIAFTARGIASSQWWRNGRSHPDQCEIWLRREGVSPSYERISDGGVKEMWPMWSPDGKQIYFVSDRSGEQFVERSSRLRRKTAAMPRASREPTPPSRS